MSRNPSRGDLRLYAQDQNGLIRPARFKDIRPCCNDLCSAIIKICIDFRWWWWKMFGVSKRDKRAYQNEKERRNSLNKK